MPFNSSPMKRYERAAQAFGCLVIAIAAAALIGWFGAYPALKGIRAEYVPMAPSTAMLFLLVGTGLVTFGAWSNKYTYAGRVVFGFVGAIGIASVGSYLLGFELQLDHWVFRVRAISSSGPVPVGKMASLTAMTFVFVAGALLLLTFASRRWINSVAQALSVVVVFIGLAFSLGYLYGAPLLYGGRSIPMALNTAVAFVFSGTALLIRTAARDAVERYAAREVLQKAHDELETRVNERTAELVAQQQFLRAIVDTSPNPIFVKDSSGRFTLVNKAVETAYGRSANEILGKTEADFNGYHEEIQTFMEDDAEVLRTLNPKFIPEEQLTNPNTGETRYFQTIKVPLQLPGHETVNILGVASDITDRKRSEQTLRETEDRLRQSQRLEAIGQLAGGVAHDFNNLLTVIGGYSDLLLRVPELDDSAREKMAEVKKAAERAAALTRQLLAFSRKQVLKPEILNLNSLIEGLAKMLGRLIGEHVEIEMALDPNIGNINADRGQIEQVLTNLVVNARDAMPTGGTIMIRTANVDLDRAYSDLHIAVTPGAYVMVVVTDTGSGMDAETRQHIFEPFFTTKEMGRGTGLGLSTIYGIVKQSGGNIWVYSEPAKGSTFKIYLPRVVNEQPVSNAKSEPSHAPEKSSETILLVEDEEIVRKLTRDILQSSGYDVLIAKNGEEALDICKTYSGEIDLMLTDVVMPRMNGRKVAEGVSASLGKPIRVLYMSGYTDDAIVRHGVLDPGTNFIEKPFTAQALTQKIRETLNQSNP